jgi:hypothetical protein
MVSVRRLRRRGLGSVGIGIASLVFMIGYEVLGMIEQEMVGKDTDCEPCNGGERRRVAEHERLDGTGGGRYRSGARRGSDGRRFSSH